MLIYLVIINQSSIKLKTSFIMVTKTELNESVNELSDRLTGNFKQMLEESIQVLKSTIIENLSKSNLDLQARVSSLENEIILLKQANIDMTKHVEASFQHGRQNQIIVSGIPSSVEHDDLEMTTIGILNKIKSVEVNERDIEACHRVGKNDNTIIRFVNRKDAEDCLTNSKKLKDVNLEDVGLHKNSKIYVNQNLSPFMSTLAYYCRILKRKDLVVKLTTFKGVLKITRKVDNRFVTTKIGHKCDIEKLFPNLEEIISEARV